MIEGAHLPHQMTTQGEAMITRTNIGLELHLVSLTQFLHSKTSWRRGYNKRGKGPFHHTMGNDAMSKAL